MTPYKSRTAGKRQSTRERRRLRALPVSQFGEECYVATGGQRIRVNVRWGTGVPLVLCNGIGASLEVLDPLVAQLDPETTVVRFDAPGTGGGPGSPPPFGFSYLAAVPGKVLRKVGITGHVDVLGLSWGGALAQQFAFQNPRRCRRLILVSTGVGIGMGPGRRAVFGELLTPQRFMDPDYAARLAGELYGGGARADGSLVQRLFDNQLMGASPVGYAHQPLAAPVG